jgi:ATP synthase protein I
MNPLPNDVTDENGTQESAIEPAIRQWSADEVGALLKKVPVVSLWRMVAWQVLAGSLMAVLAWWLTGRAALALSVAYGALCVVVPAAVMARGLASVFGRRHAGSALVRFAVWELVKIVLTVAMLLAAPKLVEQLSWLALLAGFVVTMKVYWLAMWRSSVRKT